jgi:hypothetical protein
MSTVEAITAAIAELPPDQVARIRAWLDERAEAEWDAQIEQDERAGKLDALAERALAEHRAGRTRPL